MSKFLPDIYYIKSDHDFGQRGLAFKTPLSAELWLDMKFGRGGAAEGKARGMYSIEVLEILYIPSIHLPEIKG
ncbi:hypothetical protein Delta_p25 [Pseudomonas phage Delta]|nr:hypothetical protein Delta_p25 [Pseudomonas phage Delta]